MRVVVRSDDVRAVREAQARLGAAGIDAIAMPGLSRPAPDGEDVSVFCGPGALDHARDAATRNQTPLAALAALPCPPPLSLAAPALDGARLGAIDIDAHPLLLASQFEEQVRVAIIEEEAARCAATLRDLGIAAPLPCSSHELKALYVGAPSASFLALERAVAAQGGAIRAAFSSFTGFDHLHDEAFDAVVLNGAEDAATALSLCAALRRNTALCHLPTMLIANAADDAARTAAYERGASAIASSHDACGESLGWLFEAIRRERRRRRGEHDLRALRDLMGDARTGLFQPAPFKAHLARLAQDHHHSGRPLSLVALRVTPAFGASEPSEAAWARGFAEIASLAARLMREADCGAALGRDLIALALPASNLDAARRSVERIASVAECTAFASGDGGAGPLVFERSVVELQAGESGAALLARALRGIEASAMSA